MTRSLEIRYIIILSLIIQIKLSSGSSQEGVFFAQNPRQTPMSVKAGDQVTFECAFNISYSSVCPPPRTQPELQVNWLLANQPHVQLTSGNDILNMLVIGESITNCSTKTLNSTITFIASLENNNMAFQCAVHLSLSSGDNHPLLKSEVSAQVLSEAAALKVNVSEQSPCNSTLQPEPSPTTQPPTVTTTKIVPCPTTSPEPCTCPPTIMTTTCGSAKTSTIFSTVWSVVFLALLFMLAVILQ